MSDSSSNGAVQKALGALAEFNSTSELSLGNLQPQAGQSGVSGRESHPSHYWTRPNDGWVVIQPGWPTEAGYLYERGFTPLKSRFGVFYARNQDGWDTTREPWRRIFMLNGQDVFPVEQVLEYGWHRKSPYQGKELPQLEKIADAPNQWRILTGPRAGQIHEDVICPACDKPYLSRANLRNHELIAHKESSQNNEMARAIADAQTKGLEGLSGPMGDAIRMLAESQERQGRVLEALMDRIAQPAPQPAPAAPVAEEPAATPAKPAKAA